MNEPIRLQKLMASRGMCSRRQAEEHIRDGNVRVNGTLVTELGTKVSPDAVITIDGETHQPTQNNSSSPIYILLHKPVGYITSTSNEQGCTVLDLLIKENYVRGGEKAVHAMEQLAQTRVYPVGRLDKDSEGLVLLTNDGALTNRLTHPRYHHEKEYEVTITGRVPKGAEQVLMKGMDIGDGERVQGIEIKQIAARGKRTIVTVILKEGKNRQIRRMFGQLGMEVIALKRTRIDTLTLGTLPVGRWVLLSER